MRFKRGVILVLMLLGCLCVPAGAAAQVGNSTFLFDATVQQDVEATIYLEEDVVVTAFTEPSTMSDGSKETMACIWIDGVGCGMWNLDGSGKIAHFSTPIKLSAGEHRLSCGFRNNTGKKTAVVKFYGKIESEPEPEPIDPISIKSQLPKNLLTNSISLSFSKAVKSVDVKLLDASGKEVATQVAISGSSATVRIMDKAYKAGQSYTFKLTDATAEDGGKLDKPYSHAFEAVPEKPPEPPVKPPEPKLYLKSALPDYLLKSSISLEFSSPVKDVSVQLLDASGKEVATQVAISGSSATVQITDAAFQSGQPYTFKLLGATAEDGGKLEKTVSHSFKEMVTSGNQGFDMVMMAILSMFSESKTHGLTIVILAVFVGLIFVLGRWLWAMSKVWLRRAKY